MIKNERQYKITKAAAKKFRHALLSQTVESADIDPLISQATLSGIRAQLEELNNAILEYEELKSGAVNFISAPSIDELPKVLIKARIASGLTQKDLATKLGLKEQQIQRYEESEYATASFSKLIDIAAALNIDVSHEALLNINEATLEAIYRKLSKAGLPQSFIDKRFSAISGNKNAISARKKLSAFLSSLQRVYRWDPTNLFGDWTLTVNPDPAMSARFKVRKNQNEERLAAYAVYAHYLAMVILPALDEVDPKSLPNTAEEFYDNVVLEHQVLNFENVLKYIWSLGIAVLPLNDRASFDGAYWRMGNKHVVALSQRMQSTSYWLFDLLHDYFHATQHPEMRENVIVEFPATSNERRQSPDEVDASNFAGDVALAGQAEALWMEAYEKTNGDLRLLKSKLPLVAENCGVDLAVAANYLAFKLSMDGEDWWGTAQTFQPINDFPWIIARDIFLENVDIGKINQEDRKLLSLALSDEERDG